MNTSHNLIKWTSVSLLTFGASLFLGLLSFSGMYVLWPITGLAILSCVLSVLYEGEIYKKNLNKALDKLLNKDLVLEKIGEEIAQALEAQSNNIAFLKDYHTVKASKNQEEKAARLQKMHIWLGKLLKHKENNTPLRPLQRETLEKIKQLYSYPSLLEREQSIRRSNRSTIIFSGISMLAMSLGTAYLMLDALEVLPFISLSPATLPFILIPLSIISGIAYGLLTYNSLSDFFLNPNIGSWWQDLKDTFTGSKTLNLKNITYGVFSTLIIALNLALTICTAGTWWTVVNQSRNLGVWLQNVAMKVFEKIIPVVIGISTLGFNLKNTIDTIKHFKPSEEEHKHEHQAPHHHGKPETRWQKFNIFRWILKLTYMPIRILLFLGHLFSIGVSGDRMPGVSPIASALLGMISEGFEDTDYFFDLSSLTSNHHHEDEHSEDDHVHSDLPNLLLQIIFSPLFLLAAAWHWKDSEHSYKDCLMLMLGRNHEHHHDTQEKKSTSISPAWAIEESCTKVDDEIQRLSNVSFGILVASQKIEHLNKISEQFSKMAEANDNIDVAKQQLQHLIKAPIFNCHRFWQSEKLTSSQESMQEIQANLIALG